MPTEAKRETIEQLRGEIAGSTSLIVSEYRGLKGSELAAIVEGPSPESEYLLEGRLRRQAPEVDGRLLFSEGSARAGDLVDVRIEKTYAFDLVGKICRVVDPASARRAPAIPQLLPTLRSTAGGD